MEWGWVGRRREMGASRGIGWSGRRGISCILSVYSLPLSFGIDGSMIRYYKYVASCPPRKQEGN
jgi:hypothetical protein